MTTKELAAKLDGHEYRTDFPAEVIREASKSNLVICYGHSDDLIEFDGAFCDEGSGYGGGTFLIDKNGFIGEIDDERDDDLEDDELEDYLRRRKKCHKIKAIWCDGKNKEGWSYETKIPHETFQVKETEKYGRDIQCIGIVFSIADLT